MYHNYFGLKEQAFSIAVNPRYLYMSQQHKEALAHLLYGVKGGGFVLLSGEVGTGKTTIIKCLLEQLPDNTDMAIVLNPMANVNDMLRTICDELGTEYNKEDFSDKELTDSLHEYLLKNHTNGHNTVLLIDEAQLLSPEALEQIRLLTNLETTTEKLLQIILVGQPELNELLAQPRMRQLSQRITARFHLTPLTLIETQAYIRHRLEVAGMPEGRNPYPPAIIRKIHRFTGGIPRLINIVCERMLIGAYGHNKTLVDKQIYKLACSEVAGSMEYLPTRLSRLDWRIVGPAAAAVAAALLSLGVWLASPTQPTLENEKPMVQRSAGSPETIKAPTPSSTANVKENTETTSYKPTAHISTEPRSQFRDYHIDDYAQAQYNLLKHLSFDVSSETHPCWELTRERIQCKNAELNTWDELKELNRPSVLILTTPEKFTSHVIVIGLGRREAEVLDINGTSFKVPLSELGPLWTGQTFYIWKRPESFNEPLVLGQRSNTIRWLAEQFAVLDQREQPLTRTRYNSTLQERVKIFQRNAGLKDDGIVGEQTLMKINEALGIDQTLNILE